MLKKLSLVIVALTISTLGARLVAWVTGDPRAPVSSGRQIILIAVFFVFFVAVAWLLETQKGISFNWPWHRRRFFLEMSKAGTLGTERILRDPNYSANAVFVDVLEDRKRRNLVDLLHERLKSRDKPRRILILGEAGSGKSTALKQLRLEMLRDGTKAFGVGKPIPLLAPLGRYNQTKLLDYTREIFKKESQKLSAIMEQLLQQGRMVLLLDALDEALGSNALTEINDLLSSHEYRNLAVVITGRPGEYEKDLPGDVDILSVQDLSDEAVRTFSQFAITSKNLTQTPAVVFASLEDNQLLIEGGLGRNPFWLDLILQGETFSNNKTEIFGAAVKALFDREWNRAGSKRLWVAGLPKDEQFLHSKNSLAALAQRISARQEGEQIDGGDALKVIDDYLSRQTRIEKLRPQDVLWLARDELLINFDNLADQDRWPPVRFRHRLIREYLTAVELSSHPESLVTIFAQHAADDYWWETLIMLGCLAADQFDFKKREELVNAAMANSGDPRRLFFATAMLESIDLIGERLGQPVMAALVTNLRQGVTDSHAEAAASLGNVAPQKLLDFIRQLVEQNDPSLTAIVEQLLKQLFQQQAGDKGRSKVFADFLGNPYLENITRRILVELGPLVTLRVIDVLRDPHSSARWHAAEVLGDIGDTRAVEPLIELLSDPEDIVQRESIESLGKLKDVRALRPIAKLFGHKGETVRDFLLRPAIIRALGNFGPSAIDELISMLKSDDVTVRIFAALSLKQIGPPASGKLIEVLDYNSTWTRKAAVELLGEFREVEAIGPLIRLLDCPDVFVRDEAIDSLVLIGTPAVEPLLTASRSTNPQIRKLSAVALGRIGDKRALEPLIGILKDRAASDTGTKAVSEALVRAEAARVLGDLGDTAAIGPLNEAVENDRLAVGVAAMGALAKLGDAKQLNELHHLLRSDDENVQFSVIQALGRVKSPQSLSYLEAFRKRNAAKVASTNDKQGESDKVDRALRSINKILEALVGPPAPPPPDDSFGETNPPPPPRDLSGYAKLLKLQDESLRLAAAKALAEIGKDAVDLLLVALTDQETKVRIAAAVGLGDFGGERALQPLLEVLQKDPKASVQMTAAESLGKLGLPAAIQPLKAALADENLFLNIGAAIGLNELGVPGMVDELENILQRNKAPLLRHQNARAYLMVGDVKAIPYLEKSLKEWQEEGVAPEDASNFENATAILTLLKKLQQAQTAPPQPAAPPANTVQRPGIWTRLRKLFGL